VRKQAALQQLGQTCPGLVRLGWLGHAGPGAQTRPQKPSARFGGWFSSLSFFWFSIYYTLLAAVFLTQEVCSFLLDPTLFMVFFFLSVSPFLRLVLDFCN